MKQLSDVREINLNIYKYGVLILSAISAYGIAGISFNWIGRLIVLGCFLVFFKQYFRKHSQPFIFLFGFFFTIVFFLNIFHYALYSYEISMPALYTGSSYKIYMALRYLMVLSFFSTVMILSYLLHQGYYEKIIETTVNIGVFVSIVCLYFYIADIFLLYKPMRNLVSTNGHMNTSTYLNYTITTSSGAVSAYRLAGTFKEPAGFCYWIFPALYLQFIDYKINFNSMLKTAIMGLAFLLTISMNGYISFFGGIVFAFFLVSIKGFLHDKSFSAMFKVVKKVILVLIICFGLFFIFRLFLGDLDNPLMLMKDRLAKGVSGGVEATNRAYVWNYFLSVPIPLIGYGFGNPALYYANYLNIDVVASLLSIYLNHLYVMGSSLYFIFLLVMFYPLLTYIRKKYDKNLFKEDIILLAMYFAFCINHLAHYDELDMMFAIPYAFLLYWSKQTRIKYANIGN